MKAKFINESNFDHIKESDIVTDELYKIWKQDEYLDDLFSLAYAIEHNISDISKLPKDFLDSNEYNNWYKYEMEYRCNEIINMFNYEIIHGSTLNIYRSMLVDKLWIKNIKQGDFFGIYWSYEEDAAEPHWGYNDIKKEVSILIEGEVNINDINWIKTIQANMHPSYEEEKEIYLDKDTLIKLISIKMNDKYVNIGNLKNKMFKA